jgi:hypothetical protein
VGIDITGRERPAPQQRDTVTVFLKSPRYVYGLAFCTPDGEDPLDAHHDVDEEQLLAKSLFANHYGIRRGLVPDFVEVQLAERTVLSVRPLQCSTTDLRSFNTPSCSSIGGANLMPYTR